MANLSILSSLLSLLLTATVFMASSAPAAWPRTTTTLSTRPNVPRPTVPSRRRESWTGRASPSSPTTSRTVTLVTLPRPLSTSCPAAPPSFRAVTTNFAS